jgi:ribose transport system permease protein
MNADRDSSRAERREESAGIAGDAIMTSSPDLESQPSAAEAANPVVEADRGVSGLEPHAEEGRKRRRINLGMDRFSGLYVWAALIILFSFWVPDTFPTSDNAKIIAGDQAITAMLALGIIIPLAAGVFDLSFAGVLGVSVAIVGYLQSNGWNVWLSAAAAIAAGAFIGAANGFIVVQLRVNSFIATLGMSSLLVAAEYWITDGKQITDFNSTFLDLGTKPILGFRCPSM